VRQKKGHSNGYQTSIKDEDHNKITTIVKKTDFAKVKLWRGKIRIWKKQPMPGQLRPVNA